MPEVHWCQPSSKWSSNVFFMIRYVKDFFKARASIIRRAEALCKFAMRFQIHRAGAHCKFAMSLHNCHCTMQICNAVGQEHIANLQCHCKSVTNLQCKFVKVRCTRSALVSAGQKLSSNLFFMIRYVKDFIKATASIIRRAEAHCKFAVQLQIHRARAHCKFAMPLHNANLQCRLAGAQCKFAMPLQISSKFAMQVCEGQMCPKCTGVRRAENCHQTYFLLYVTLKTLSRRELEEFVWQEHIANLQCRRAGAHCKFAMPLQISCKFGNARV